MNETLRAQFPVLQRHIDGKPIIYLDSAATALKPRSVLEAEQAYLTQFTANVHRGKHALSQEASTAFEHARRRVARFLNADPYSIVFVRNATEGINLVARGLPPREGPVLALVQEHHSNLVPWMQRGPTQLLRWDPTVPFPPEELKKAIAQHRPSLVTFAHASHVTGVIQPIAALCRVAREAGVLSLVDAAQSAAHLPLDVEQLGCDFLVLSGHKVFGPTGIGVLYGRSELLEQLQPVDLGGGTVDRVTEAGFTLKGVPYRFEGGTPHISGAIGLAAALDFLERIGFDELLAHEKLLADELAQQLGDLPGARVVRAQSEERLALASIVSASERISADHLALALSDAHKIMVRSGHHCAHPLFDYLEAPGGSLRVSTALYNTVEEIRAFGAALRGLLARLVGR